MTFICSGFNRVKQRLGTVYGNYSLDSQATGINAYGSFTITLPSTPSTNQIITINNIGSGIVTVSGNGNTIGANSSISVGSGITTRFIWGGYSWGAFSGSLCAATLPLTKDFGAVEYSGPFENAQSVPDTTVTYESIGYTQCGGLLRKTVTRTYSSREVSGIYRANFSFTPQGEFTSEFSGTIFAVGATANLCASYAANNAANGTSIGATYIGGGPGSGVDTVTSEAPYSNLFGGVYSCYVISYFASGNASSSLATKSESQVTIGSAYYLDVNEVWTYEII